VATRYAITHVGKDGLRTLTFANQGRNHYATRAEAEALIALFAPGLRSVLGAKTATLEVREVDCYDHGDAKGIYFDDPAPIGCPTCREWAKLKHERKLPVAGDTYCGDCGTRESDVSKAVAAE